MPACFVEITTAGYPISFYKIKISRPDQYGINEYEMKPVKQPLI